MPRRRTARSRSRRAASSRSRSAVPARTGDPDLYVRFGAAPTTVVYHCRPYLDGAVESCALTVPANASQVFVMVRGYAKGKYDLTVKHVPPTT